MAGDHEPARPCSQGAPQRREPDEIQAVAVRTACRQCGDESSSAPTCQRLDVPRLHAALDRCLLGPAEFAAGPARWRRLADPFGSWEPPADSE